MELNVLRGYGTFIFCCLVVFAIKMQLFKTSFQTMFLITFIKSKFRTFNPYFVIYVFSSASKRFNYFVSENIILLIQPDLTAKLNCAKLIIVRPKNGIFLYYENLNYS